MRLVTVVDRRMVRRASLLVLVVAVLAGVPATASGQDAPDCGPDTGPVHYEDDVEPDDARTYRLLPFEVQDGTTRVEVAYDWGDGGTAPGTPLTETTVDLGMWDEDGPFAYEGFRGWSGSRHRQVHVQADSAQRGYLAAPVDAGLWHAEVGIAAVNPEGGWYEVEIRCLDPDVGDPPPGTPPNPDPVDPDHVARSEAAWYHADLHMHGYHSHPDAPDWEEFVAFAREQQLDVLPVTEYTTNAHWYELGAVQRDNADLLIWPSREIITYHGHAVSLGETWDLIEYRHGFRDITMAEIQRGVKEGGALFGIAHPTTFEGPGFENLCRGCPWELDEYTDWSEVDTFEIQTGPAVVRPSPQEEAGQENPFMATAIDRWEELLNEGFRITAVGGSDDKWAGQEEDEQFDTISPHGVPATAIWAEELSRDAIVEGVREGRVYVRNRGVADSPALELQAVARGGERGTFGSTFATDDVRMILKITGGAGQVLRIVRNGETAEIVAIPEDEFTYTWRATREPDSEGPLGTWWRVETRDHEARTTVSNPVFLTGDEEGGAGRPDDRPRAAPAGEASAAGAVALPTTGAATPAGGAVFLATAIAGGALVRDERR